MCGLFCIISKSENGFTDKQINIFTQGLFADTLRGEDSTGAFSVTNSGNVHTIKDVGPGHTFIKNKNFDDFLKDQYLYGKILVGHNRSATRGVKTDKNAHPFISGNTVLVHNGTLLSHHHLANTNTDSEAICIALDKKENPIDILSELDGAFALIWYNAKTKQFHVSRNNQRPLWILETEHYDLIGSEAKLLEWISWRNGGKDIVQDRTIYEDAHIFAENLNDMKLLSDRDFNNYSSVFNLMKSFVSAPDLLIYLRSDVPNLVKKIYKRGRDYEASISIEYLTKLNQK